MFRRSVIGYCTSLVIGLIAVSATFGQESQKRIGIIDFYGYASLDLEQVRSALPIREGDLYPEEPGQKIDRIKKAVILALGRAPTDIMSTCCDGQGNYIIFIGLPGDSIKQIKVNPIPKGNARLPPNIATLYEEMMSALIGAVLRGNTTENTSRGYAVSASDSSLRAKQLRARSYSIRYEALIRRVLESSGDAYQRIVAAYMLGYARQSTQQIASLVHASHDPDETVRNNATRALSLLAESSQKGAAKIPADGFIEMLSSGSWSDRNKASWVLSLLTRSRDPKLLGKLRSQALVSLIEMARWRSVGHAYRARILIGRIAGIEEKRLIQLANENKTNEIIRAVQD